MKQFGAIKLIDGDVLLFASCTSVQNRLCAYNRWWSLFVNRKTVSSFLIMAAAAVILYFSIIMSKTILEIAAISAFRPNIGGFS